jgi:type I restriction enzyme S subunit
MKSNWKKVKLGDIAAINNKSIGKKYPFDIIEYVDISSVGTGILFETTKYDLDKAPSRAKRLVKAGDVILSTVRPNRRSFFYFKNPQDNLVISTGFAVLTPDSNIDSKFLYYIVFSQSFTDYLTNNAKGATYPAVDSETIERAEIYIPERIEDQKKIASILSGYDDLIENNNRRIKILEEMAQAIYKQWFVDFKFPGYEKVKMVDSSAGEAGGELGSMPEGWEVVCVEDVIKRVQSGKKYDNKTAKPIGAIPILDQGRSGFIGYHDDEPGVMASKENPIIVFANHTCYQNLIMFPFSAIQNILPFLPNDKKFRNIYWLHWATKDLVSFNDYKGHWPEFISKRLFLPNKELCQKFGEIIEPMIVAKFELEKSNSILRKTRDLLLPKLMSEGMII